MSLWLMLFVGHGVSARQAVSDDAGAIINARFSSSRRVWYHVLPCTKVVESVSPAVDQNTTSFVCSIYGAELRLKSRAETPAVLNSLQPSRP